MSSAREHEEVTVTRHWEGMPEGSHHESPAVEGWDRPAALANHNSLYTDRNRTRVTIDFEGLLTLREVYQKLHLDEQNTLADYLVIIDYRKTEDYC